MSRPDLGASIPSYTTGTKDSFFVCKEAEA